MLFKNIEKYQIVLASQSPRRRYLLKELGVEFETISLDIDESFPNDLRAEEIPLYLCKKKAEAFEEITDNTLLITADTIVWIDGQVLNKPQNKDDATRMLKLLSGNKHVVYTGVCLKSKTKTKSFFSRTDVYFKTLSEEEIEYYINKYQPFDKAGAYGAQEFMGYIAIDKLEGSYFNVMGLPIKEVYEELLNF